MLNQPESQWGKLVKQETCNYAENFDLLLTHAHLEEDPLPLQPEQTLNLLQPLIKSNHQLVVDCGHQLTSVVESVLAEADQIIVCLRPERVALANARQLLEHLHEIAPAEAKVRAIIFDFSAQMAIPHQALEKFLNHSLTAVLPMPPADMNQAVNKSVPLVQLNPQAKAAILIRQIAQKLVKS